MKDYLTSKTLRSFLSGARKVWGANVIPRQTPKPKGEWEQKWDNSLQREYSIFTLFGEWEMKVSIDEREFLYGNETVLSASAEDEVYIVADYRVSPPGNPDCLFSSSNDFDERNAYSRVWDSAYACPLPEYDNFLTEVRIENYYEGEVEYFRPEYGTVTPLGYLTVEYDSVTPSLKAVREDGERIAIPIPKGVVQGLESTK